MSPGLAVTNSTITGKTYVIPNPTFTLLYELVFSLSSMYSYCNSAVLEDALILITEWEEFRNPNFEDLGNDLNQKIIFDGRNIYNKKIIQNGFELYQIGC